jgi:hypothetical protein
LQSGSTNNSQFTEFFTQFGHQVGMTCNQRLVRDVFAGSSAAQAVLHDGIYSRYAIISTGFLWKRHRRVSSKLNAEKGMGIQLSAA